MMDMYVRVGDIFLSMSVYIVAIPLISWSYFSYNSRKLRNRIRKANVLIAELQKQIKGGE